MPRAWMTTGCVAAALVLCAALAGCGGASTADGGKVTLRFTWWGNADRAARTERAVAAFERAHPRIDVQTSYAPYESYKQKLATQAAGSDAPDVMQLDYRQISQYAGSGVLLDLAKVQRTLPTGDVDGSLLKTGRAAGAQYALPIAQGTQALAYDRKVWRAAGLKPPQPGWTWGDLTSALRALKERTGAPQLTDPGANEDWFEVWLRGQGKQLYDERGQAAFSAEDLTRYWSYTTSLRKQGLVSPARDTTQQDGSVQNSPMGRGKAIAEFNWDAPSAGYTEMYGKRLALAPMPAGRDGTLGQYEKPAMLIGIGAGSEHPTEAARFIDFLLNSRPAADILGVDRGMPVNQRQQARLVPQLQGFQQQLAGLQDAVAGKVNKPPAAPPRGDNGLQSVFQKDYDQVAFDKATPRQVAEDYLTEARAELRP